MRSPFRAAVPIHLLTTLTLAGGSLACHGCTTTESTASTVTPPTGGADLRAMYALFGSGVQITLEGTTAVIRTTGVPDHKSPYFGAGDARYEAYNGPNPSFALNPNRIIAQTGVFRIPLAPVKQATATPTPLGPIGVSVNGVPLFNQYAGPNQPLTGEINSFDQYAGHPQQTGIYHYHVEPTWLTRSSREALVGVLLDGFPVYGPLEGGRLLTSADLDAAHGHTAPTKEFPAGVYHYHTTGDAPYINGSGFMGVPGTVSQ